MSLEINYAEYKNFIEKMSDIEKENLGDDPTSCWLFAHWFHNKYSMSLSDDYSNNYPYLLDINSIILTNGIYSFYTENNVEFHHFVIEVKDEQIKLYSTYGGQIGLIRKIYDKTNFVKLINDIYVNKTIHINDKISKYQILYGIRIRLNLKNINFDNCVFRYDYKIIEV
jgi:hypothetical protein